MKFGTGNFGEHGVTNNALVKDILRFLVYQGVRLRSLKLYHCSIPISGRTKGLSENTEASTVPILGKAHLTISTLIAQSHGPKSISAEQGIRELTREEQQLNTYFFRSG